MNDIARIDKWLWAARIYKTRSIAADACKNGRVTIKGINVKPSHTIKAGEVVSVKKSPITYSFKVLKPIEQRVGTGRPTKKDRRQMDAFVDPALFGFDEDEDNTF